MDTASGRLTDLSLTEASRLIERGELSPVELTLAHLRRIEQINPQLNCFITLTAREAVEAARIAEAEISRGHHRGPLHGLPIGLKDLFETRGVRTTAGSPFLGDNVPEADAAVVERLKAAGVIVLGKLNTHEWALGVTTDNRYFGACKNPWALDRIPGGSSGGSAAALAAELCTGALGTDTGGSIRIPAALCGVVGLKPTYGRVSLRGVLPLSWSLDHVGPMARRVADVALLLQGMAGYDPDDPASASVPGDDYVSRLGKPIKGWRVGLAEGPLLDPVQPEVRQAVEAAARVFSRLGAVVSEVPLPVERLAMVSYDAAAVHAERMASRPDDFAPDVLARLRLGAAATATDYALARRRQAVLRRQYEQLFTIYDLLMLPTTAEAAPVRAGLDGVEAAQRLTALTVPFNWAGLPALSVPCGFTSGGLPVGLQLVGPHWGEAQVLQAGYAYELATEWHLHKPTLALTP